MSYDLQAEGTNGVHSQTTVTALTGFTSPVLDIEATTAPAAISARCNSSNGIIGQSGSSKDSGVWGENTSTGYGVSGSTNSPAPQAGVWGHNFGSGYGVRGDSGTGEGVFGQGKNGVHGQSGSPTDSGVWGENTGSGAGVGGSSVAGYGGDFTGGHAPLRLRPSGSPGSPTTGSHAKGELFVDSTGSLFYCKSDGVPGTWVKLA